MPHTQYSRQSGNKWGRREVDVMMEEVAAQEKDRNIARKRDENKIAELGVARRYPYEHAYSSSLLPLLSPLVLFRSLCFSLPLQPSSVPISHATYIEHFLFASYPAFKPVVVLQATRYVNYYANKQCETSVPTSHKTTRIPSDFRGSASLSNDHRLLRYPLSFV